MRAAVQVPSRDGRYHNIAALNHQGDVVADLGADLLSKPS